jgi:hypothetical protein
MAADNFQVMEAASTLVGALLGLVGFVVLATALTTVFLWRKARAGAVPTLRGALVAPRAPWNTFPVRATVAAAAAHHYSSGPRI